MYTALKTNVWNQNFDILQIHCCNFVTVHLQLSLPIYCSNLKVFLWRLYFIPTISSCPIHFIRTIQSKLAAREHWYKFRGLCLSLLPPLRSEYTGAGAGVKDGQETVVMIWCTELYSTVQHGTVQYGDTEREQEMVASGQTSRDQNAFKHFRFKRIFFIKYPFNKYWKPFWS